MTQIAQQDFLNSLFKLLRETFEEGGSYYLEKSAGLGFVNKQDLHIGTRPNDIVPFTVKCIRCQIDGRDLVI